MTQQLTLDFQNILSIQDSEPTTHHNVSEGDKEEHEQEQDPVTIDDYDDEEFSFSCSNPDCSPISPSSAFRDGQIRPMFPLFDTSLLSTGEPRPASSSPASASSSSSSSIKKLFSGDRVEVVEEVTVSSEACKKSHSTGHSRVWRFRELMTTLNRSHSDGKDAFVFLKNGHNDERERGKSEKVAAKKKKKSKTETASPSAHEKLYVKNRERNEDEKRKSYLPYRQGLVGLGFFTNVNHGLSRTMHPY